MNHTEEMQQFLDIQNSLRDKIIFRDNFKTEDLKLMAGVDLAYWKNHENQEFAVCCIVIMNIKSHEIIERKNDYGKVAVPYLPGYLAFRELPLILKTVALLEHEPDIYMFDGNGYLHPRNMGIATHASFYLNKPTIGVAKSYFKIENTDYIMPKEEKGSYTDIIIKNKVYGRVLRTQEHIRPVFLSIGNYITLDTAMNLTLAATGKDSHIPIPTRLADIDTHLARTKYSS